MDNIFDQKTLSTSSWTPASELPSSWQAVYPIQVRIRANDAIPTATSNTGINSASSGAQTQPPTETDTKPAQTSSNPSSSSGSSTPVGAIVGGVIGGLAVVGIIAAIVIWTVLRAGHRKPNDPQPSGPKDNGGGAAPILCSMPENGATQPPLVQGLPELQNQAIPELQDQRRLPELFDAPSSAPPAQYLQGQWEFQPQMQEMWAPVVPPNSNPQGSHSA